MAAVKSPLRDRLLSPDPIKSSIIRDSGLGWLSSPSSNNGGPSSQSSQDSDSANGSITSPLRISKRTSSSSSRPLPQQPGQHLTRRSSSSYKHMATNSLVSKSPFKQAGLEPKIPIPKNSSIPFPVTRRVSGEKRPRPVSIHNQAEDENDRPFALKRERRQSKSYQGLVNKTPVSKSPFRSKGTPGAPEPPPPSPEPSAPLSNAAVNTPDSTHDMSSSPEPSAPAPLKPPTPSSNGTGPSPGRSNLVSRRMHGPRVSSVYKRERRKTVTWDERMEVVEFDRDEVEDDEEVFEEDQAEHIDSYNPHDDDPFFSGHHEQEITDFEHRETRFMENETFGINSGAESGPLLGNMGMNVDGSISGIVDNLFGPSTTVPQLAATQNAHHPESLDDHNSHVERETQFMHSDDEQDHPDQDDDEGVLARFRRHSRSPSLHHIQDFSPPPNAHSSPAGARYNAGSPHPSPLLPSRPSSRQSAGSPRPGSSSGTPSRALPQTPQDRFARASTPTSDRSARSERNGEPTYSGNDEVVQFPASPSPARSGRRISNPEAFPSFEASYHNMQEHANASTSSLPQDETSSSRHLEDMSRSSAREDEQTPSIYIPEILDNPVEAHRPSTSRRSSTAETGGQTNTGFEFPRRSQSPFHQSATRLSDQRSPPLSRRQSEEHSFDNFSSRGTSPAPSSANTSRISLDHIQERSRAHEAEDMDVEHEPEFPSHEQDYNRSVEGVAKIVELDQPVAAGKLDFDLGSNFENSISIDEWDPSCSADDLDMSGIGQDAGMLDASHASMKMGDVDVDMDMRSALDRLMDDVAGTHGTPYVQRRRTSSLPSPAPSHVERSISDSIYEDQRMKQTVLPPQPPAAPVPPPKTDNIKAREQMILQKRRAARRAEEGYSDEEDDEVDGNIRRAPVPSQSLGVTRPSRRRSLSTGDVEAARKEEMLLEVAGVGLSDSIEKELQKLNGQSRQDKNKKYLVRERETIYASSNQSFRAREEYDLADKAWKAIRRPSDMNEYAKQIREYRAQEKTAKAYGKVFVKVMGVKSLEVPLPNEPTALTCTLNNGIHFVTTPECPMGNETRIDQEFELIEHSKLEFTLTLKIRRDPHIIQQFKDVLPTPPPPRPVPVAPPVVQQSSSRGMRSFFSSSPKKSSRDKIVHQPPAPPQRAQMPQHITNNLARYLKPDCTLARAFVSFKEIANRCDTRLFETTYPLIGQRVELGGKLSTCQVGEIVLQIFRLPPLPGVPPEQLPQSLDECLRGLRHINWHKVTYFEGTLTQLGGDCNTWRRRRFRVIGSSLVAFNDVTKRATATIDLKKAVGVEDNQDREHAAKSHDYSDDDSLFGVERSFRLLFPNDQIITFFADSDEEKARWLDVFRALIGHIPPHPLWGELLWQRQEECAKGAPMQPAQSAPPSSTPSQPTQPAQPTPTKKFVPQTQNASPSWLVPKAKR